MFLDITPLRVSRDYRLLFFGQLVSFFGTMMSFVAIQWQMYDLTGSSEAVGFIAIAEFVPMFCLAFVGGAIADFFDKRKILRLTEIGQTMVTAILFLNALMTAPRVWVIYLAAALHAGLAALQRPAFESFIQKVIPAELMSSVMALNSVRFSVGAIISPAVAGVITAGFGAKLAFGIDLLTFLASLVAVFLISAVPAAVNAHRPSLKGILDSWRYALSRQYLLGTYLIDIAAMFFAFPQALYPALAKAHGDMFLGLFPAAIASGALIASLTSGWTRNVFSHGKMITAAAILWGFAIVFFGLAGNIWVALFFLMLAGFFDMISGIFRGAVWNQTIPNFLRGRMASIEMMSYLTGPYLGSGKMGIVAERFGLQTALVSGGILCIVAVILTALFLPKFIAFDSRDGIRTREEEEKEFAGRLTTAPRN